MSIFSQYQNARQAKGKNPKERREYQDRKVLKGTLTYSPNKEDIEIGDDVYEALILSRREDMHTLDKKIVAESHVPLDQGQIIRFNGEKWLALHTDNIQYGISKKVIVRRITHEVYFFVNGKQILVPVYLMMSASSEDAIDRKFVNSVIFESTDKSGIIIMPKNSLTEKVKINTRVIFNGQVLKINFVNYEMSGLIVASANVVDFDPRLDDLETRTSKPLNVEVDNSVGELKLVGPQSLLETEEAVFECTVDCELVVRGVSSLFEVLEQGSRSLRIRAIKKGTITIDVIVDGEVKLSQNIRIVGLF